MGEFRSAANTELHYELRGHGPFLVCQPGGPGRPGSYLDDLGGVGRTLVLIDPRGSGGSAPAPAHAFTELADDIELLRRHLDLTRFDLLGHSAGCWPVLAYAAHYPTRVAHLVLLTPSRVPIPRGSDEPSQDELVKRWFAAEPWYPAARAAWVTGLDDPDVMPFYYAADRPEVREHAAQFERRADYADFWSARLDPAELAAVSVPVTIVAADRDLVTGLVAPHILASWLPTAAVTWLPDAGHFPWVTHPRLTREAIDHALSQPLSSA